MIRIFLSILIFANLGFGVTEQQRESFRNGFKTGLEMLKFQISNEGVSVKEVDFPKNGYIVYVPTKNIPMADILYLEYMGQRDGFKVLLAKEELIFGYFDRKADALDSTNRIHKLYDVNAKISSSSKVFYIYPSLIENAYSEFIAQAKKEGMQIKTDVLIVQKNPPNQTQKPTKPKITKKIYFVLLNPLTQSYVLKGSQKHSKNFQEGSLIDGEKKYVFDKKIKTQEGEIFYKVKNKDLYFLSDDIEVQEEEEY